MYWKEEGADPFNCTLCISSIGLHPFSKHQLYLLQLLMLVLPKFHDFPTRPPTRAHQELAIFSPDHQPTAYCLLPSTFYRPPTAQYRQRSDRSDLQRDFLARLGPSQTGFCRQHAALVAVDELCDQVLYIVARFAI